MKKIVVFSGAGLSKESGIPTFRDSVDGLWENHRIEDVASPEGWRRGRETVLRFYEERMASIAKCEPNAAHLAFAKLEGKFEVHHVTQNIDNLLERAGCSNVLHLHGTIGHRKCENHVSLSRWDEAFSDAGFESHFTCDYRVPHVEPVKLGDTCVKCGGEMRPDVVWFGEPVNMGQVQPLIEGTYAFVVVGTSCQVYPAADLLWAFQRAPRKVLIDPNPQEGLSASFLQINQPASVGVPQVVEALLKHG